MPNFLFSLLIDRDDLGLTSLDLNDHISYYVSSQSFMGGQVQWNRNQVTSPFIDGSVTTYRTKQMVTETVPIEVIGANQIDLVNKITTLVQAFEQDTYNLQLAFNTAVLQYECEAADYTVSYASERWAGSQALVTFSVPRQPVPITGNY